ncbi:efflux RND transporter periplasmic adaptor subunit [Chitinolyticbacter meiyuanensis]|uniref:efflux RND transporter periplasmic adaptor subunit n=1 Tax=Chitinolyticbacter meiyuanensis TaxID=682798 RepID=UPI0011E5ECF0|nr:efflux RND transporter periplasmic adaptor subunit [Chitinolyticbacter meiyuanensis]
MSRPIFSASWHSVAELKLKLSRHARMERHTYRGKTWYVIQDLAGGQHCRIPPASHAVLMLLDGERTVAEAWEQINTGDGTELVTQNDMVDLLVQLHSVNLIQGNTSPDAHAILDKKKKKQRNKIKQWITNPLSLKIPLYDPDRLLEAINPVTRHFFTLAGLLVWLAIVIPAGFIAAEHWSTLTNNLSDRILSSSNLLIMSAVFPVVKLLHELGHGCANKAWGGRVNEMGLMFLVFVPSPYVDASSSNLFPSKYRRALVASAGMAVELLLAALALYIWQFTEPGLLRAVAYNVIVVCGISTLIVNGNPLLKYDGYYILADLIEMPNLAQRGTKYWTYLWDRYACGKTDEPGPNENRTEKLWLFFYTPASWLYRSFVTISIMLIVATQFFFFGVLMALWSAFSLFCMPLWKSYKHNFRSPQLERQRERAVRVTLATTACVLGLAFLVPLPLYIRSDGVVWLPDQAILHAGADGTFQRWLVQPGQRVKAGTALYLLDSNTLATQLEVQTQKFAEADAAYRADQFTDPKKAQVSLQDVERARAELATIQTQAQRLVGYAQTDGMLVAERASDIIGQTIKQGELVGYVLNRDALIARTTVSQDDIDLVRNRLRSVQLRLAQDLTTPLDAHVVRQMPGGVEELPSPALGLTAGGSIATDPNDPSGAKTLQRIFLMDLAFDEQHAQALFGSRVYCRLDLGLEPLGLQGLRRLRQLFLSHFDV